ncbi:MAG: DUF3089 domain-containing protein [Solirubrobacterales bacterium]|nr:DUF3089 domain-containing protein [Solirubrobacterales bacterium]
MGRGDFRLGIALTAIAAGLATVAIAGAGAAEAKTVWLCKPGATPNPCKESLETTVTSSAGDSHVTDPQNAKRPRIDCFYVYPTVSEQPGPNADKTVDPQQTSIAEYQASRYSRRCRVFAPMYRQLTLSSIGGEAPEEAARIAYSDILEAWKTYMKKFNHGRGVVLIGHSQGTFMLRRLIHNEIDPSPKARAHLVSAILLGGNVTVRKGKKIGGDFQHIPACVSARQTGCVIAFSTFGDTPPADALFGRHGTPVTGDLPSGPNYRVLCTNPAALGSDDSAPLKTLLRTEPFPGTLGIALLIMFGGPPPTAATPWLQPQDHYTGRCVRHNGVNALMIDEVEMARHLAPSPDATWGLHFSDANIALGNLTDLVKTQAAAYGAKAGKTGSTKGK